MRKTISTLFFIAALTLAIIPVAALTPSGLTLTPGYAVVVDNFYVPEHPPWFSPGAVNTGSQLALRDSDGTLYIIKGYSFKNWLPPWDAHSYIALIKHSSWGDQELAKVEVSPGNYKVKAYFRDSSVVVVYGSSERLLGTFTPRSTYLDIYVEACTPRLERIVGEEPNSPTVITASEWLTYVLIGLGFLAIIMVAAIIIVKRR